MKRRLSTTVRTLAPVQLIGLMLLGCIADVGLAQPTTTANGNSYYAPSRVSPLLHKQYVALGDHLQRPGNERATMNGTLTDPLGSAAVRIVIEHEGKVRIDFTGNSAKLVFDGTAVRTTGTTTAYNSDLLEALVDDMPDTLMLAIVVGNGFRLIGGGFPNPAGGTCDVYDVPIQGQTNKSVPYQLKRYCFDSATGLLQSVLHLDEFTKALSRVETHFGNWQTINGQAIPGGVVRLRNGSQVFSLQAQSIAISASAADGLFGP
jgi:hypothetical protein